MSPHRRSHALELERIRLLNSTVFLRHFASRNASWELLWIVYELEGDGDYGINDYIDALKTLRVTRLTMQKFVNDRISDGSFIVTASNKKSRKTLKLSDTLKKELEDYSSWLSQHGFLPEDTPRERPIKNEKAQTANHANNPSQM